MHRLDEDQTAELGVTGRLANDDPGFVGLPVGGTGNEIFRRFIFEVRQPLSGGERVGGCVHRPGSSDGSGYSGKRNSRWILGKVGCWSRPLSASSLSAPLRWGLSSSVL